MSSSVGSGWRTQASFPTWLKALFWAAWYSRKPGVFEEIDLKGFIPVLLLTSA
jgi:hypothetical protein